MHTYLTFDYSLHSIPAGRFKIRYAKPGCEEKTLSHSGDTKYDVTLIENWYRKGNFTEKRRDQILGFVWDADLIVHDVGGGLLHTEESALDVQPESVVDKMILVHQHSPPNADNRYHYASEGSISTLIPSNPEFEESRIDCIKPITLFRNLDDSELMKILNNSEVQHFETAESVFRKMILAKILRYS